MATRAAVMVAPGDRAAIVLLSMTPTSRRISREAVPVKDGDP